MPKIAGTLTPVKENVAQLGERVMARRRELGLSQVDVWQAGGPSNSTLTGIENGSAPSVSASTLRKLDVALRWLPGSAAAVLRGGDPKPEEQSVMSPDELSAYVKQMGWDKLDTSPLIPRGSMGRATVQALLRQLEAVVAQLAPVRHRLAHGDQVDAAELESTVLLSYALAETLTHQLRVHLAAADIAAADERDHRRQIDYDLARREGAGKSRGQQIRDDQDASSD